ncbi:Gramicidin S synthase II [Chromobacterium violaceum]|uniref:Gramicidin S synthase II n=1 Tax=Chromobacterium violaceum TaxID=536 RepID=A0A3S5DLN0_CHRVL|nr:Gramicidin S synthase II [Chromobacterium violaceum]
MEPATGGAGPARGADLLIAIVGVLKSGAAYMPLDEGLTAERRQWLLADSGAKLSVDAAWLATPGTWPEENPAVAGDAESVAYLMYTSGSTGEPKGVLAPHRGITRLVCGNRYAAFQATTASPGRPIRPSTPAPWKSGRAGAWRSLVAIDKDTLLSAEALGARLQRDRITILWLTAGLFQRHARGLGAALSGLRYLMVGGDVVDPRVAAQVRRDNPPAHLLNCYGPTETTTFATTHEIGAEAETAASLPIGKPIGNTRIYILDGDGQLAPLGVAGELYIGGAGWRAAT